MNHQPFNEWIYQDAPLTEQDEQELKAHLKTCPVCQDNDKAWQDVNGMLKSAPMMPAAHGFVNRWQASLADRRQKELRRQVWMGFLILSGA
ncbi:MAG TPA: zf-HC2 domain-containing protein, partial [Anaerolineaceae bacterium]|nr:zf-HC2 domain-containing protein [Anaerolineaceae bacterium]